MASTNSSTPLIAIDAVVLDTETTGLDARSARVVQLGAVRMEGGRLQESERLEVLVNPGQPIPAATSAVHGITDRDVRDAPRFAEVAGELERFIGPAVVIGHTLSYDFAVLKREHELAGLVWRQPRALDIRHLARIAAPTLAHHNLDRLCDWLSIPVEGRHTAIGDAVATARVFAALLPELKARNIRTLAEAEAACRQLAEAEARTGGGLVVTSSAPPPDDARTLARIDSFPYRHRVRDVMSAPPVFVPPQTTLADAIRVLLERKVSSVYIRGKDGGYGIVTERDALRAIDAEGAGGLATRVEDIMSMPLQTIGEDAFVYRAIGRLDRLGFRHLAVTDAAGAVVGAITTRNLLRHRASTAIMLGDEIDSAVSVEGLARAWARLPIMARNLLDEEVDPRIIAAVISSEIRALTRRAAQMAEEALAGAGQGRPPVPYAVLVLGSAGRGESLLAADQDNAIVYEKGDPDGPEDRYFKALAEHMTRTLDDVGVPYCKGGVMASNAAWRMSLERWHATIDGWVRRSRPQDLLNVDIFFDSVPVHGDTALGEAVWSYAYAQGGKARDFVNLLTEVARKKPSAFTMFGGFKLDEKGRIDLKRTGLFPIFTAARVLSIRHGVMVRPTPDRYAGVAAKGIGSATEIDAIVEAHRVIMGAMLGQQLADTQDGIPLSPRVAPERLDKAAKARLREALGKVDGAIDLMSEGRL